MHNPRTNGEENAPCLMAGSDLSARWSMDRDLIYLRKSRTDVEAEQRGEGETLRRHEKALLDLSEKLHLTVGDIYREIETGDSIAARPVMQRLLSEVEQGLWSGVLVMEVERLARGDTIDQGIVAQTFKLTGTKIITPIKTYDPNNEFDEEYFEFGLFMSRREYKTINRRLQRGRLASVKEGKYVANHAPYGYRRVRLEQDKGWTLEPKEGEAETIRLIFEWYTAGDLQQDGTYLRLGVSRIARRLNEMRLKPQKGEAWVPSSIRDILINPVYIGKLRWNWRPAHKKKVDGQIVVERPRSDDAVLVDGLHPPLITEDTYSLAQEYIRCNRPAPTPSKYTVSNPLAGLVVCGKCGRKMVRRPYKNGYPDTLMCAATFCDNVSSPLELVEKSVLGSLRTWLCRYKLQWESGKEETSAAAASRQEALIAAQKEIERLEKQEERTHDLLEQGVYDIGTFLTRSRRIADQKEEAEKRCACLLQENAIEQAREENQKNIIPRAEHLIEVYDSLPSAKAKNELLKDVLEKAVYVKEHGGRRQNRPDDFQLSIYPKLPKYGDSN
jgi:Site-specific recombinases, DNA invertase Pin homologs